MHILGRRRLQGGDEAAIAGHVNDRDFEHGKTFQSLGRDLNVAEYDDLVDGCNRDALDLLAVLSHD